jgi:predicted lipoprotein with Yx(FWY)xxD motif
MKLILAGFAAVLLTVSGAMAAKTMDTAAGKIWTDEKGMTLYERAQDKKNESGCYDACAKEWPAYIAAADAKATAEWTVIDRKDGTKQWAYDGHPTYTFDEDKKPGDVKGDGKKDQFGEWHALKEKK